MKKKSTFKEVANNYLTHTSTIRGITLISLIITIIILLILAGITISQLSENGLFGKAINAKKVHGQAEAKEQLEILLMEIKTEIIGNENRDTNVKDCNRLENREGVTEIEYISEETASTTIKNNDLENAKYAWITFKGYKFKVDNGLKIIDMEQQGDLLSEIKNFTGIQQGVLSGTEYKINNTTLTFNKIVVVGEDEELETLKDAFDYLCDNNYKENVAIVLKEGTYTTQDIQTGNSYNINTKYNGMNISIIADTPGKVFLSPGETGMTENGSNYGITLKFYRIVFENANGNFHMNMDKEVKEYYNCVINTSYGGWNGNVSDTSIKTENCLFISSPNGYYSGNPTTGTKTNNASVNQYMDPCNGTETTCLTNVTVDDNYNITSNGWKNTGTGTNPDETQASIGVYGGEFAWPGKEKISTSVKEHKITINTSNFSSSVRAILYVKKDATESEIRNSGIQVPIINNVATIENVQDKEEYSILILPQIGDSILKKIKAAKIPEGAVDYWPLQGNLNNSNSEGQNFITNKGTPSVTADYVLLENGSSLMTPNNYTIGDSYTMYFEAKNLEQESGNFSCIVGQGNMGGGIGGLFWGIMFEPNSQICATTGAGDGYSKTTSSSIINDNLWHKIAITYGNSKSTFYIDGVSVGTVENAIINKKSTPLFIGSIKENGGKGSGVDSGFSKGYYKNLIIYDRCLAATEIANIDL